MQLKPFQTRTLGQLTAFFRQARKIGPKAAFETLAPGAYRVPAQKGKPVLAGDPPYVCLRIPTGGGKTLVAAYAVGRAFTDFLDRSHGLVLWLVPSKEIAEQTLRSLRWPRHSYRLALQDALSSEAVQVKTLPEALELPLSEALAETVVIVSTLQAFRVTATEGRKVYDDNGQLYAHREALRAFQAGEGGLDCFPGTSEPLCSLRNVLAMHRPLVILDEAHNARTHLSFETLARLNPGCLVEFTATPDREDNSSNVLVAVPAIATGTTRDLKGKNLFNPMEHTRVIITQKALVEGWDCSFAYVLCALTESHSAKDVEQLLGRILRMPEATPFANGELNRAYGVLATTSFQQTVMHLREKFVEAHGFTRVEANQALQPASEPLLDTEDAVGLHQAAMVTIPEVDFSLLPADLHARVETDETGRSRVSRALLARHQEAFANATKDPVALRHVMSEELSPAQNQTPFLVPLLLFHGEPFQDEHFAAWPLPLDQIPLNLDFDPLEVRLTARLDARGHELELQNLDVSRESHLPYGMSGSEDPVHLSHRLDLLLHRNGANRDVPQHLGRRWCLDLLMALQAKGQVLDELDRGRFRLAGAVDQYWASHRQRLRQKGFAAALMDTEAFASSPSQHFAFGPEDEYNPTALSPGIYSRHRYLRVGAMNSEELQVALALDSLPSVAQWVRNLEHSRTACCWLQASLQAFFPDFVALLKDGRTLVVEYKGAHLIAKDQDKKAVGERWAATTGNAFEWVTEDRLPTLLETWFKRYPAP